MKTKKNLNRRDFIGITVAGSSILLTQSCGTSNNQNTNVTGITIQENLRIRYSINSPDKDAQRNVAYFKKAVAKMKAISKKDLTKKNKVGWIAQAEIHKQYCSGTSNLHNTGLFLPWHRAYLFFFEEICRHLLREEGITDWAEFALPYWDWNESPRIPDVFGDTEWDEDLNTAKPPDDWGAGANCKWERCIKPKGEILGDILIGDIFNNPSFYSIIGVDSSGTFGGGLLLSGPHATVHNEIGGNMGNSPFAALDPIFWIHHANIDRIWSKWMEKYAAQTPSPKCLPNGCGIGCRYVTTLSKWLESKVEGFYKVNDAPVDQQIINLLDTYNPEHLGYRYYGDNPINWNNCPQLQIVGSPDYSIRSKVFSEVVALNELKNVRVGDFLEPADVNSKILKNMNSSIFEIIQSQKTLNTSSFLPSLLLFLEVKKPATPAISVRLFINSLLDKSKLSTDSPYYVATFSFFESSIESHQHHGDSKNTHPESRGFVFNLTNTILRLYGSNDSNQFNLRDINISIFPILLANQSSNRAENIELMSFTFDLAK